MQVRRLVARAAHFGAVMIPAIIWPMQLLHQAEAVLGPDTFLTLVCGREIAQHGLPRVDSLTALTLGQPWIDQQWLAQWLFYATSVAGGMGAVFALHVLVLGGAMGLAAALARKSNASTAATLLVAVAATWMLEWEAQIRAQSISELLFVCTLWTLRVRSRAVWLVLALWANVHGGVMVGAGVVALRAALDGWKQRRAVRGVLRASAALAMPLATPYGAQLLDYYGALFRVGATGLITEWGPPSFEHRPAFFVVAAMVAASLTVAALSRALARLDEAARFGLAVVAVTLVATLLSGRSVVWFALALVAAGPPLLDRLVPLLRVTDARPVVAFFGLMLTAALGLRLDTFVREGLPRLERASRLDSRPILERIARDSTVRVLADEGLADRVMWEIPELRGRVLFDVRYELLGPDRLRHVAGLLSGADPEGFRQVSAVLLGPDRAAIAAPLVARRQFRPVHAGDTLVLVRESARP